MCTDVNACGHTQGLHEQGLHCELTASDVCTDVNACGRTQGLHEQGLHCELTVGTKSLASLGGGP